MVALLCFLRNCGLRPLAKVMRRPGNGRVVRQPNSQSWVQGEPATEHVLVSETVRAAQVDDEDFALHTDDEGVNSRHESVTLPKRSTETPFVPAKKHSRHESITIHRYFDFTVEAS